MLTGRTGLSPVMVGRSTELRQLVELTRRADTPTVALISGEAGIGKTRLVQELVAELDERAVVIAGQAEPTAVSQPLDLVKDVLKAADVPPGAASDLFADVVDTERSPEERTAAVVDLIRMLTTGNGRKPPGIVVFEDLHWADPESLAVFEQLLDPAEAALTAIGSFRPDGLSRRHPASSMLPRLERRHRVHRIHLSRLSPADIGTLLNHTYGRMPPFRVVQAVHGRTGGNPFFVEELIAAAGPERIEDLESLPLPWTVTELVRNQVDEIDDPAVRRVVDIAAVLGRRVGFDVLAAVTETSEDELIDLLNRALGSGLLVEIEPDYFGFRHELAREAIESGLLGRKRRRIHEAAHDALRRADSHDHAALAHHARGAGRHRDMVDHSRAGAHEALSRGATYQSLQLAEIGLTEADDDLDLLAIATEAAWLANLLDDARDHATRGLQLARAGDDVVREAEALRLSIRVAWEVHDLATMTALTEDLIATLDRLPNEAARAGAMAFVAQSYMLRQHVDHTCEWADKARALAESAGLDAIRLAATVEKGSCLLSVQERKTEASAMLEAAAAEAGTLGEHVLAVRALGNLLWNAPLWHDPDRVRAMTERMRSHARAAGWLGHESDIALAYLAAVQGDFDEAVRLHDIRRRGIDRFAASQAKGGMTDVLRAGLALEVGDLDTTERLLEEMRRRSAGRYTKSVVHGVAVRLACHRGDPEAARTALREQTAAIELRGFAAPAEVYDVLAAALPTGTLSTDELYPLVESAGWWARGRLDADDPWRQMLDAQLAEADGDTAAAATLYAAAAAGLDGRPDVMAVHMGAAHIGATRALVALDRPGEARDHAEAAGTHLTRWRGRKVEELDALRRRLGIGTDPGGPSALTPREREVAALLAEGLTNSGLAEHLYISPRTAAVHVSNILAKLGMSSRTEVAAWVAGGGLGER